MALIELNRNPSRRELRQFAAIWFPLFFALLGGLVLYAGGSLSVIGTIWAIVAAVCLVGFFVPPFIRTFFIGWMYAAYPIGWVLSNLILATFYFLVITPVGLLIRAFGRDPMQRRTDPAARSYWTRREPDEPMESYLRQY